MTKAIRIETHGGPEVLKLVDVDVPAPGPDQVRVRNHAVGLNFIDIYFRSGLYKHPFPHGLGSEGAGVVDAVGENVTHVKPGDRVAYGQGPLGAYSELHNVPGMHVVKLPDAISFEEAAGVMLKGLTVQYLFRQTYKLQAGETILFHAAAGGVGLIACQWARALGVRLIGTVSSDEKAALAKENGAWETINYSRESVPERVLELTQGQKLPVVYDSVGKDTWEASLDCLQPRGLMVSFGNASGPVTGVNLGVLANKGSLFVTRPTLGGYMRTRADVEAATSELFGLITDGKIKVNIGQRFRLEEAGLAQQELAARKTHGATVFIVD